MILAAQDIITDAMNLIGAIAIDETPTTSEFNMCLRTLNVMIDSWSAQSLMLRSTTTDLLTLVPGQYNYTIGPLGNFNTAKPIQINSAFLRDSQNIDTEVNIMTQNEYEALQDKAISDARPESIYYDPGAAQGSTTGTLYIYPMPDASTGYVLHLESFKYLTEFVNLTDIVTFEPAYYEALQYGLAVRLFRQYHSSQDQIPADLVSLADTSKRVISKMNTTQIVAGFDLPGKASVYNIYTDQSR